MSYQKNTWVDHIVDPGTGEIVQQGTKFTATRANNIETGIEKAHQLVEGLAQNILGSSVTSGLTFTTNGLTANYTAGSAYVNGVKFDVAAGSIQLNATQGQYIYLDSDGMVKNTTSQATADAKCKLWYFATDATTVITSTDSRNIVSKDTFVKQTDVAANGANKIPRLDAQGKGAFSITGDAATVGGKSLSTNGTADTAALRDANGDLTARQLKSSVATGTAPLSVSSTTTVTNLSADKVDGYDAATAATASTAAVRDASGDLSTRQFKSTAVTGTAPFSTSSTTVNANFNADMVDGYHVGSGANQIPTRDANAILSADVLTMFNQYASGKDANGIYTVVDFKRADGTLFMKSTLSNPDANGKYQTDTWQFYNAAGTTVVNTKTWTITYDADGKVVSKVVA